MRYTLALTSMLVKLLTAPIIRRGPSVADSISPELKCSALTLARLVSDSEIIQAQVQLRDINLCDNPTDSDMLRVTEWLQKQIES